MRRTEAPSADPAGTRNGPRRDPLFQLAFILFVAGGIAATFAWYLPRLRCDGSAPSIALPLGIGAGLAGLVLAAVRISVLGISRLPGQLTADSSSPDGTTWEERHPGAVRAVAALMASAALVAFPFLARRSGADSFEFPRGAAIAFLLLAGLAADAVWSSEFGRDRFQSAATRALAAFGAALLAAPPSLLYWRWTGMAPPWEGVWGEGGAWWVVRRFALELAIGALALFAAPLLRWFRGGREDVGRE